MSNNLSGISSLAYQGTNAPNPPNVTRQRRDPNSQDWQNFSLMDEWLNTNTQVAWKLVSLAGNVADWVQFTGSSGSTLELTGDTGTAIPSAGMIKIAGGSNINTAAAGSTVTINLDTTLTGLTNLTVANLTVTNSETFSNLGQGVVQSSSSGVISSSEGTNGQILIGSNTVAPAWANIMAGSGITVTNGSNSIEIAATGGGGGGGGTGGGIIYTGSGLSLGSTGSVEYTWSSNSSITLTAAQGIIPTAGTITNLYADATSNASTTNGVVTLNINGVDTALTTTITALTTGTFTDLTHSIAVNAGDLITFKVAQTTTGAIVGRISVKFSSSGSGGSGTGASVISAFSTSNLATAGVTIYSPIFSLGLNSSANTSSIPVAGTINNLYVGVVVNSSTTNATITLNVNGSDTALAITVPALTTGVFSDLTHSIAVNQGDLVCFHSTGATTGSIQGDLTAAFTAVGASSGSLVLIQTQSGAGVTAINFTTGINTTYRNFLLLSDNVNCPTASFATDALVAQVSTDGGATYKTTNYLYGTDDRAGLVASQFTSTNIASNILSGETVIYNLTSGVGYIMATSPLCIFDPITPNTVAGSGSSVYRTANTLGNAIRVVITGNKVFSGNFSLYGYVK